VNIGKGNSAMARLSCFKAYDVRGKVGSELTPEIAFRIARGLARVLAARRIVVGRDNRDSSPDLADAVTAGLCAEGVEVLCLGLCGSEEMYFATSHFEACGGLQITASHNPIEWNGIKMVRKGSAPLDAASDLNDIRAAAEANAFGPIQRGSVRDIAKEARSAYVARVASFVQPAHLRPLRVVVNAGNGAAGPTFDAIADWLSQQGAPLEFIRLHHDVDSHFPNGIPNPLLPENQPVTGAAVRAHGADLGIAWDGDFDRCFFFDHSGRFIAGEYIVGLLAEAFLAKEPGARIAHDPRLVWNTQDIIAKAGGQAVLVRTGHAHFKQALRDSGAVYGGEISAHHYFRDFYCCDSGMIPWLLVLELISRQRLPLAELLAPRIAAFHSCGEINFCVPNPQASVERVAARLSAKAVSRDDTDGLSLDFGAWRFNLRASNTEPLLRLNVEARGKPSLLMQQTARLTKMIQEEHSTLGEL